MVNPIAVIKKIQDFEKVWGEFIRDGPADGLPGYVRDKYRERCDQFANLPPWAKALSKPVAGSFARACEPYWDDQGTDGPVGDIPFPGGQCQVLYNVSYQTESRRSRSNECSPFDNPVTRTSLSPSGAVLGPIGAPTEVIRPSSQFATSNSVQSIEVMTGSGLRFINLNGAQERFFHSSCGPAYRLLGFAVTRVDGLADDCGSLPPTLKPGPNPPPDPGPVVGPEPTDDPDNPTGPPLIPIPPYEDPVYGPIPIVGDPEPTDPGGGGNPSGGDGLPGAPDAIGGEAGGASGGGDGEDVDFGEPPEGKIWHGALVQATVDSRLGNIPGTGPEQTVYPTVIGNASLIYAGGRGSNTRLESASTLLTRQTTALVLTGCRVHAIPGVDLTVKAISAVTCPDNPCEEQDG